MKRSYKLTETDTQTQQLVMTLSIFLKGWLLYNAKLYKQLKQEGRFPEIFRILTMNAGWMWRQSWISLIDRRVLWLLRVSQEIKKMIDLAGWLSYTECLLTQQGRWWEIFDEDNAGIIITEYFNHRNPPLPRCRTDKTTHETRCELRWTSGCQEVSVDFYLQSYWKHPHYSFNIDNLSENTYSQLLLTSFVEWMSFGGPFIVLANWTLCDPCDRSGANRFDIRVPGPSSLWLEEAVVMTRSELSPG